MKGIVLGLYPSFSCIADRCPATCCSGWKVVVDPKDYKRFQEISDQNLREDILGHIIQEKEGYYFQNEKSGDCTLLDSDRLCRIQRNLGEEMLCNTCRKFPRLTTKSEGILWISLAASCPVVAEYLLTEQVCWNILLEDGRQKKLLPENFAVLREGMALLWELKKEHRNISKADVGKNGWEYDAFSEIAADTLDIILKFPKCSYLEGSFDYYGKEISMDETKQMEIFARETRSVWEHLFANYFCYRYPSRYLEYLDESSEERFIQVMGEILLIRIIACSVYQMQGKMELQNWMEILHWSYRFFAHGRKMTICVHQMFLSWRQEFLGCALSEHRFV